jgi:Fe(3+) dicitrate transport protein
MRLRVYSTAFLLILYVTAQAQYRLSGALASEADSSAIKDCVVYLNEGKFTAVTDSKGRFLFQDLPNGNHTLHFTSEDFQYHKVEVNISNGDRYVNVTLSPRMQILDEVTIRDEQSSFGFTRMRAIESMGIYEGKKSEVIIPEQLVANLATNNARQVYSRVAGLNIWENDGAGLQLSIGGQRIGS